MDYKRDLKINKNLIDSELEMHPQLFMDYAVLCAEAEEAMLDAEQNVKIVIADLAEKIRNNPRVYGLSGKTTETAIKLVIDKSFEKKKAKRIYHKTVKNFRILESAKDAFGFQRKMALEKLADFTLSGYHSKSGITYKTKTLEEKDSKDFRRSFSDRKSKRKLI